MSDYFNVTTNVGDAAIATAIANNSKLNITHIALLNEPVAAPEKLISRAFFSLVAVEALPFTPFKGVNTPLPSIYAIRLKLLLSPL